METSTLILRSIVSETDAEAKAEAKEEAHVEAVKDSKQERESAKASQTPESGLTKDAQRHKGSLLKA